jgi:uncharacterized phiE125 gp8 family phage protein
VPPTVEPVSLAEIKKHLIIEHDDDNVLLNSEIAAARKWIEDITHTQLVCATYEYRLDGFPNEILLPKSPALKVASVMYYNTSSTWTTLTADTDYDVDKRVKPASIIPAYGAYWPTAKSFRNVVKVTYQAGFIVPVSANATTDKLTLSGFTSTDADAYELSQTGAEDGKLPGGLSENTAYYIITTSGATCELSATSGGAKIDLTSAGTGQVFLGKVPEKIKQAIKFLVGHLYEHREQTLTGTISKEIEVNAMDLISHEIIPWEQKW